MFRRKNPEKRQNNGAGDVFSERCPQPLLGRPAIEALAIVKKVDAVEASDLKEKFPGLRDPDYVKAETRSRTVRTQYP